MAPRNEAADTLNAGNDDNLVIVRQPSISVFPANAAPSYKALMSVDYAACEQTKCRSLASLPFTVVKKGKEREAVSDHPLAKLLNGMPNEDMSSVDLLNWHRLRCDTYGVSYWRVEWWRDEVVAIWPILCHVEHDFNRDAPIGRRSLYRLDGGDDYNKPGTYFSDEVICIKTNVTKDCRKGVSLATLAAEQIGLSLDLERFYRSMLENGNHQFGHVEVPATHMPDPAKDDLRAAIDSKAGISNAGSAPIFAYGAKWVNDNQTMKDASVIEQQKWVLHQVCRACNVPPWKVYEQEGSTYAASQQANIDYVTDTILPDVRAIEQAFIPVFLARNETGFQLKGNVRGLMRGDDASRAQYYREMTYSGVYTREDVRDLEDMPPIDGLDRPLFPLNYGTVEEDGSVNVYSANKAEPADGSQTGLTD